MFDPVKQSAKLIFKHLPTTNAFGLLREWFSGCMLIKNISALSLIFYYGLNFKMSIN